MNGQILAANEGPLGSAPLSRLLRPLAIPRQMRHDAEQTVDDHQLGPVVNLMLLAADQHLEAAFVPWTGPSACYELDRPRFGELLDPIAPAFSPVAQHCQDLGFRKRAFLVGRKFGEEPPEIKTFHRGALLLLVNVKIEQRHRSHVKCQPTYAMIWSKKYRKKVLRGRTAQRARDLTYDRSVRLVRL
jgi:hypothetical protein